MTWVTKRHSISSLDNELHIVFELLQYDRGHLNKSNIVVSGLLHLRPQSQERAMMATSLRENELWSSINLCRQLNLLGLIRTCSYSEHPTSTLEMSN